MKVAEIIEYRDNEGVVQKRKILRRRLVAGTSKDVRALITDNYSDESNGYWVYRDEIIKYYPREKYPEEYL